jgi:hypothetical protein
MAQSDAETARLSRSGNSSPQSGINYTYNNNKYSVSGFEYPTDLSGSADYGGHKVLFLINVNADSKLLVNSNYGNQSVIDIPKSELKKTAFEEVAQKANAAVNETAGTQFKTAMPYKRLLSAISLYVPNDLSTSYSVGWGEEDLSGSEALAAAGLSLVNNDKNTTVAGTVGSLVGRVALGASAAQKATRTTPGNSKAEQLFQGVDFRTFSFNYDFAPRNITEADAALKIIRMFRHHMLPEFKDTENQFLYLYPSEFEIKYFKGDKENEYLEKHFTAVLMSCNINYTPDGQFSTFANGMPSRIRMALTFKELAKATKETSPYDRSGT